VHGRHLKPDGKHWEVHLHLRLQSHLGEATDWTSLVWVLTAKCTTSTGMALGDHLRPIGKLSAALSTALQWWWRGEPIDSTFLASAPITRHTIRRGPAVHGRHLKPAGRPSVVLSTVI
jgi:hypothetical protein